MHNGGRNYKNFPPCTQRVQFMSVGQFMKIYFQFTQGNALQFIEKGAKL